MVHPEAVLASMLSLTPKIEAIHVNRNIFEPLSPLIASKPVFKAAMGVPVEGAHRFEHLRSITVDYSSMGLNDLLPLFKLPSVRELTLSSSNSDLPPGLTTASVLLEQITAFKSEYRSSPVTNLTLAGLMPVTLLKAIILVLSALEKFHFRGVAFLEHESVQH
ncbi:hypothetical protein BU23DRAFT_597952 [Bimuria novae-zelandiae CBS 107.79]|uniref:RNI-like protein n=1 Tax=Bimuria novae-zelandiae CBS 107.79 TaxID=1447943 RepID=A0A6A5VNT5_9PLEO|nr:hypothetical protein BU23DRAFT_597952 [Bimuria novae-zelandiae CBS 107.79]